MLYTRYWDLLDELDTYWDTILEYLKSSDLEKHQMELEEWGITESSKDVIRLVKRQR